MSPPLLRRCDPVLNLRTRSSRRCNKRRSPMVWSRLTAVAAGLTLTLAAWPVLAQQVEYKPDVANCGDPSYANAVKNGINLGSNDNPPEFYQDANKQPAGIDWEINKAVLDVLGIKKFEIVWMPWESVIPSLLS